MTMRSPRSAQLRVGGLQVHHQVAVGLAQPDHRAGGEDVEHQLGGRARLHPGGAGDDLGPDVDVMTTSQVSARHRGRLGAGEEDGAGAERSAPGPAPPCTNGVVPLAAIPTTTSRAPTRRSSIARRAGVDVVLGAFDRADQRLVPAGDDPLHHLRRRAEGGRALRGVEHAEPAAGAGADVEEPPAGAERPPRSGRSPRAIDSRAAATAAGTVASSAANRSTISSGAAVSMSAERGIAPLGGGARTGVAHGIGPERRAENDDLPRLK